MHSTLKRVAPLRSLRWAPCEVVKICVSQLFAYKKEGGGIRVGRELTMTNLTVVSHRN